MGDRNASREVDTCVSSGPDGLHVIAVYRCCRDWPVSVLDPVGPCGLCGEIPDVRSEPIESNRTQ